MWDRDADYMLYSYFCSFVLLGHKELMIWRKEKGTENKAGEAGMGHIWRASYTWSSFYKLYKSSKGAYEKGVIWSDFFVEGSLEQPLGDNDGRQNKEQVRTLGGVVKAYTKWYGPKHK